MLELQNVGPFMSEMTIDKSAYWIGLWFLRDFLAFSPT